MAATVFNGSIVKALKNGLKLGTGATIYSGSLDPSSAGFAASEGDVYISSSAELIYVKTGSGDTNWTPQVSTSATQSLSNKTLISNSTTFQSAGGTNRKLVVEVLASDNTTTTLSANQTDNRTVSLPDATTTLLGHDNTATVTNKTLATGSNSITGTASRVAVFNGSGNLTADGSIDTTELGYLNGVSSNVQTQLDSKPNKSSGDINETSFSASNNQAVAADVTGLAFANATVRSFEALVSVFVDATSDLFESFKLQGIQRGSDWMMSQTSVGDTSGFTFTITAAGQVQYTSSSYAGFSSATVKFRAITTSI